MKLALANNRDLRVAALNVDLARARYGIQRAALLPGVNATGIPAHPSQETGRNLATRAARMATACVRWVPVGIQLHTIQAAEVTLLAQIRLDNAITTIAYRARITTIRYVGATGYARLPWGWTLPAGFDLTDGIAAITIVRVAVIAFLTWVQYASSTGAYRSGICARICDTGIHAICPISAPNRSFT